MAGFQYEAMDAVGALREGSLQAESARAAREILRDEGLTALTVVEVAQRGKQTSFISWTRPISTVSLSLMTRRFAGLLAAKTPVERALQVVADQTEDKRLRSILSAMRADVTEGRSLSDAVRWHTKSFPSVYAPLTAIGERSGALDKVYERLADYLETERKLHQKGWMALLYPIIVSLVAFSATFGLLYSVVPKVAAIFDRADQQLPLLTRALITISQSLNDYGFFIPPMTVALLGATLWLLRDERIRFRLSALLLKLPLFGPLVRDAEGAKLAAAMAILLECGAPLLTALQSATSALSSLPLKREMEEVNDRVKQGASLAKALAQRKVFGPLLEGFIDTGERNGQLDHALDQAAKQMSAELEHRLATLTTILEPLLILVMGGMVLILALAIMLPIFDMNQLPF